MAAQSDAPPSRTQRIMESADGAGDDAGGAGASASYGSLLRADRAWEALKTHAGPPPPAFVSVSPQPLGEPPAFDAVVLGGTLGVFTAAALSARGWRVAVVEAGPLVGRTQEWNATRRELQSLVALGVLTSADADAAIASEFNPGRCTFPGTTVMVRDILNLGLSPAALVAAARRMLESRGGVILEGRPVTEVTIHADGARIARAGVTDITARLVVDALGHGSPLARQARAGTRPDGVCLVVGTASRGHPPSTCSDIIASAGPPAALGSSSHDVQLFWEAFPAGSGPTDRTTYLFAYVTAQPSSPSLGDMLEAYWDRLPGYAGVGLADLRILRTLFGVFPTFRASPLAPTWDRVTHVGDASGLQSPVSFGGFGATARHLPRIAARLHQALVADALSRSDLAGLSPYLPSLAAAWLFQRAMRAPTRARAQSGTRSKTASGPESVTESVTESLTTTESFPESLPPVGIVNEVLGANFGAMDRAGDATLRPFLMDVVQFGALGRALVGMTLADPGLVPRIVAFLGPEAIVSWVGHYAALGVYTLLDAAVAPGLRASLGLDGTPDGATAGPRLSPRVRLRLECLLDGWRWGSGRDYVYEPPSAAGGSGGEAAGDPKPKR